MRASRKFVLITVAIGAAVFTAGASLAGMPLLLGTLTGGAVGLLFVLYGEWAHSTLKR